MEGALSKFSTGEFLLVYCIPKQIHNQTVLMIVDTTFGVLLGLSKVVKGCCFTSFQITVENALLYYHLSFIYSAPFSRTFP